MIHVLHRRQVDRYFAGLLGPSAVTAMFRALWRCGACRARYERHLLHERMLPDGNPRAGDRLWRSIVASASTGADAGQTAGHPEATVLRRPFRPSMLVGGGAIAGVLLLVLAGARVKTMPAPVARGAVEEEAAAPNVHLFRSIGEHQTEPVTQTIHADDGILIGYSNPGAQLSYLMVFAVDVHGDIHWYYPAYEQAGQNPAAVAIRRRVLGVELGEEIRHALPVGPLRLFALFLRRPLQVEEVETIVSEARRSNGSAITALERLPLPNGEGEQLSRLLEVMP